MNFQLQGKLLEARQQKVNIEETGYSPGVLFYQNIPWHQSQQDLKPGIRLIHIDTDLFFFRIVQPWAMALEAPATTSLLLVCGLPGSGKSSFCHELLTQGRGAEGTSWIRFCYDDIERALRTDRRTFDPGTWQEARAKIMADVGSLLDSESERNRVIVLDDNMYYRSMRCPTEVGK